MFWYYSTWLLFVYYLGTDGSEHGTDTVWLVVSGGCWYTLTVQPLRFWKLRWMPLPALDKWQFISVEHWVHVSCRCRWILIKIRMNRRGWWKYRGYSLMLIMSGPFIGQLQTDAWSFPGSLFPGCLHERVQMLLSPVNYGSSCFPWYLHVHT